MKLVGGILTVGLWTSLVVLAIGAIGCSSDKQRAEQVRLGYLPNITHAPALIAVAEGRFAKALGEKRFSTHVLHAGPEAIEAIFADQLDAAFVGPNPAINGFQKSGGRALVVVAGAAANGVSFIVRPELLEVPPTQWKGRRFGSPQIGGTQDISLRMWLRNQGLNPGPGGDVRVIPAENPDLLNLFSKRDLDGAWVPEPWATRLVSEAKGARYLQESSLYPDQRHPTTVLVMATKFIARNPDAARKLVRAHVETVHWMNQNPAEARRITHRELSRLLHRQLPVALIDAAYDNVLFLTDPLPDQFATAAQQAHALNYLRSTDLEGLFAAPFYEDASIR